MALSLSTSLLPNTFQSNGNHNNLLARLFLNQPSTFGLKHRINDNKISTPRNPPVVSAVSGSTGLESSAVSEDTVDLLDTVKVFDLNGNEIPISDLWKDRKAVVAFARHFGCVFCRKRADYLAFKKDVMDKAGAALVLIGPGSIEQAKTFAVQTKFKGEVYADPSHSSYDALRFVSGFATTFTPKAGLKIIQLYMEGYRQDWKLSFEEDTVKRGGWRQGGILVAGPGKKNILYVHKDKEAGDDPEIEDILKACRS
ncbi:thioredoxin-like protein AAED1, chloroplastic [Hibiscus syriacus]|uniref:thioredoxin-like protein AAED1, chloroplastic n=1 Tax=Hibiscus syriacus TaxID=106335 RepID=UPI001921211A|nr:thioredoxin-like protein AAED1, chloroplastic [Hibiscus syriacus]